MTTGTGKEAAGAAGGLTNQMAEGAPLKALADLMMLGDQYDRRARYAPAAFAVAPLAVAAFAMEPAQLGGLVGLGLASFVQITMTSFYAHIGRAMGTGHERRLTNRGEMPMQRWLCPYNKEHSAEETSQWRAAVKKLLRLDYDTAAPECREYRRLGRDAFVGLQSALRVDDSVTDKPARPLFRIHQEEYGFSRNLTGMLGLGLISLCVGIAVTGWQFSSGKAPFSLVVIELVFLACWALVFALRGEFVMAAAERFSESLLSAAVARTGPPSDEGPDPGRDWASPWVESAGTTCAECGRRWSGDLVGPQDEGGAS